MTKPTLTMFAAAGLLSIACSNTSTVDIGESGSLVSDYAAQWDGYAEAFSFNDGSDRVRLTLDGAGQGTLQVGDQALFPPPSDPNVGYPPTGWSFNGNSVLSQLRPGFQYPIYGAHVETKRIRLGADFHDIFGAWCAMQTSHCQNCEPNSKDPPFYECASRPAPGSDPISSGGQDCSMIDETTGQTLPVDCLKQMLCDQPPPCTCNASPPVCQCDATGCAIPPVANADYPVKIDAALETAGTELVGTLVINDGSPRLTVRLTRH